MRYFAPLLFLLLLGAVAWSEQVSAQPFRARQGVQSGEVRSLDEILNGIRRQRPGSLADVQGPNAGPAGEPHYRLKWLTPDGRVLWLDTDARTGRVLGVEGADRPGPPGPSRGGFPGYTPRRGGFVPNGAEAGPPLPEPPAGYGPPREYPGRRVPGYAGPPPGYNGAPPPRYNGPPPGYQGPPPGYDRGGERGPRGGFGRFRYGR